MFLFGGCSVVVPVFFPVFLSGGLFHAFIGAENEHTESCKNSGVFFRFFFRRLFRWLFRWFYP